MRNVKTEHWNAGAREGRKGGGVFCVCLRAIALAAALACAACSLTGNSAGESDTWPPLEQHFDLGVEKAVVINRVGSSEAGVASVRLYSSKKTRRELARATAAVDSGAERALTAANVQVTFPLFVAGTAWRWRSGGEYWVYFIFTPAAAPQSAPVIYESAGRLNASLTISVAASLSLASMRRLD